MGLIDNRFEQNTLVTSVDFVFNWARRSPLWWPQFGLACCGIEMISASMSRFDLSERFGNLQRASPRQADFMIVAGTVTKKMAPTVRSLYDQMPEPMGAAGDKEQIMASRLSSKKALQGAYQQMGALEQYIQGTDIERPLVHLVKMRASQINGCAYCLALHAREAREEGEREDRLYLLDAWREADWYTPRERAALAWTEAVTTLEGREVPEEVYEQARAEFSEKELADLTLAVVAINGWNRFNIAFQNPPVPFTIEAKEEVAAD